MSNIRPSDNFISQKGFAHLPEVGNSVPAESQEKGSLELGSTTGRVSGVSVRRQSKLQEGDLITGTVDISHERAHMLSAMRDEKHEREKRFLVCVYLPLAGVPA